MRVTETLCALMIVVLAAAFSNAAVMPLKARQDLVHEAVPIAKEDATPSLPLDMDDNGAQQEDPSSFVLSMQGMLSANSICS